MSQTDKLLDEIAALPKEQRNFDNVVRRMGLYDSEADKEAEPSLFLQYVSEDEAVRNASVDGDKKLQVSCRFRALPSFPSPYPFPRRD